VGECNERRALVRPHRTPERPHISPTIRGDASRSRIPALPSQERDDLATKLRQELNISNDDHTRIREKLSDDERIKTIR
jgi:hypothetical protein